MADTYVVQCQNALVMAALRWHILALKGIGINNIQPCHGSSQNHIKERIFIRVDAGVTFASAVHKCNAFVFS